MGNIKGLTSNAIIRNMWIVILLMELIAVIKIPTYFALPWIVNQKMDM